MPGPEMRARTFATQQNEPNAPVGVLNRVIRAANPDSVRVV